MAGRSPSDQAKAADRHNSKLIWLCVIVKFNYRYRPVCENLDGKNTTAQIGKILTDKFSHL